MRIRGRMSKAERSWVLYDVANSSYGLIIMTAIMPIYYKSYIAQGVPEANSTADWALANSAAGLLVAIAAPILGAIADAKSCKKVFLGMFITFGVLYTAMFSVCEPGMQMFTLILYGLSLICFAGGNVFYDSLLVDVTNRRRMDWISGAGYAWGYVGGGIPYIFCILLIWLGGKFDNSSAMLKLSFIITAVWWAIFSIPVLRNTRQKFYAKSESRSIIDAFKNLYQTFRKIREYKHIAIFLLAYFLYIDGVDTIIRMAVPYGRDIGLGATMLMLTVLGLQFMAFPFALLYGRMATRFGTRRMLYIAITVYTLTAFLGYLLPSFENNTVKTTIFFLLAFMIATSQGGIQALSRSFYGKLIPKEQAAEFFGFYNIFGKFATIFGPLLIFLAGRYLGHTKYGILSLVVLFVAGALCLTLVKEPES